MLNIDFKSTGDKPLSVLVLGAHADDIEIAGATVTIGNYQNGSDVLAFTNTANITGVFDAGTGILTLSGTDTVANYQAA